MPDSGVYAAARRLHRVRGRRGRRQVDPGAAAARVADRARATTCVLTHEPGDSPVGQKLRQILLDPETGALDHRAEALLYAADKAEHVDKVVRPALDRGAVVITDRYVDSPLAYQGVGPRPGRRPRSSSVARWATADLRPHLTVLLDVEPAQRARPVRDAGPDRGRVGRLPRAGARVVPRAGARRPRALPRGRRRTSTARRSPRRSASGSTSVLAAGRAARPGRRMTVWDDLVGQDELIVAAEGVGRGRRRGARDGEPGRRR